MRFCFFFCFCFSIFIGFNNWLLENGQAPAIIKDRKIKKSVLNLQTYLNTEGYFKSKVTYKKDSIYSFKGFAEVASITPSFSKILYQSDYKNYNWQNDFKNEEIKTAGLEFKLPKWGSIKASYNLIDNYTYYDSISKPVQAKTTLNYVKGKVNLHYTYRNFTLDNTVMYQHVLEGSDFFRVPQLVTRNTIYYANYLFKK